MLPSVPIFPVYKFSDRLFGIQYLIIFTFIILSGTSETFSYLVHISRILIDFVNENSESALKRQSTLCSLVPHKNLLVAQLDFLGLIRYREIQHNIAMNSANMLLMKGDKPKQCQNQVFLQGISRRGVNISLFHNSQNRGITGRISDWNDDCSFSESATHCCLVETIVQVKSPTLEFLFCWQFSQICL